MGTSTGTDIDGAKRFIYENARLLERHRLAVLLHSASRSRVVDALRPYRNDDGGWGHALEPDLRGPDSQVSAAMSALEILAEVGARDEPVVGETADWLASVALRDGRVPHVLASAERYPRAPWLQRSDTGFLTFATVAHLWDMDANHPWLDAATAWCWSQVEVDGATGGYAVKFALDFLDAVPEHDRAEAAVERLRPALRPDGTLPISGGVEGEHLTPLELSNRPGAPSRALFTDAQIEAGLDALEREQLDDGGWDFHFQHWSRGQEVEWRGIVTLYALRTLRAHGRT